MLYNDSLEKSGEYLRLALSHMGRLNIPFDPLNYSVWYNYVSGSNRELRIVLDEVLASSPQYITPELNISLYERYIATDEKIVVEKIRKELQTILDKIMEHISDAGGHVNIFRAVLEKFARELQQDLDVEAVSRVVEGILSETKSIVLTGEELKERLQASTNEVEKLSRNIEQIREQATTDLLTGLKNRRYLANAFADMAANADAKGKDMSLIFADIDHFKHINDTYGHLTGDKILKLTAEVLLEWVKGRDLVIRYGGEEFVILLPDTPLKGAVVLAEKICQHFKTLNWKRTDTLQFIGPVHLSFGVSCYRPGESLERVMQRADRALYKSKKDGRCRVTSETEIEDGFRLKAKG
jgi:diguanylate cyclase